MKRYDIGIRQWGYDGCALDIEQNELGDWVKHEDMPDLEAINRELVEALRVIQHWIEMDYMLESGTWVDSPSLLTLAIHDETKAALAKAKEKP